MAMDIFKGCVLATDENVWSFMQITHEELEQIYKALIHSVAHESIIGGSASQFIRDLTHNVSKELMVHHEASGDWTADDVRNLIEGTDG